MSQAALYGSAASLPHEWLSASEVRSVRESFAVLALDSDALAAAFYARLFELDPALRRHFPDDLAAQREKLLLTLTHAIASLDHFASIADEVRALGRRHRAYGARELDYVSVGDALLYTLENMLGERWNGEVERAWEKTFTALSQVMLRAADVEED